MKKGITLSSASKACLVCAVFLLAYALYTLPINVLVPRTIDAVATATVSMSAGVETNEYNAAAEQLRAKEAELSVRESRLIDSGSSGTSDDSLAVYSLLMSFALFVLVGLNFFFDWRRGRGTVSVPPYLSLDLRQKR